MFVTKLLRSTLAALALVGLAMLPEPTVAQRFTGPEAGWTAQNLSASVGTYFAGRDLDDVFACTDLLSAP